MSEPDSPPEQQPELILPHPRQEPTDLARLTDALSPPQQLALLALSEGQTFVAAADVAGVGRVTLWRWLNADPAFAAAYRAWKQELRESARSRLLNAADDAVSAVAKAAADGDPKVALAMLRDLGILRQPPRGRGRKA